MSQQRYIVYDGNDAFASVRAANPDEAIQIACTKTDGHNPDHCTAIPVQDDPGHRTDTQAAKKKHTYLYTYQIAEWPSPLSKHKQLISMRLR